MSDKDLAPSSASKRRIRLFTFGSGTLGELGHDRHEDATARPEATEVEFKAESSARASVSSVALGNDHSLALVDGHLYRWGLLCRSPASARGDSDMAPAKEGSASGGRVVPLPSPMEEWGQAAEAEGHLPDESSVVAIAAGGSNSYVLTSIGEVFVLGQLRSLGGDPSTLRHLWGCPRRSLELQVSQVAAGWRHCIILTKAGSVFAIGDDEHGQCANHGTGQVPLPVPLASEGLVGVAAGACHSVAWCCQGRAFSWGHGGAGRLGHGSQDSHRIPVQVQALSELKVVHARCGANFTVFVTLPQRALMFGGAGVRVWSCGGNQYGQLGHGGQEGHAERLSQVLVPKVIDFADANLTSSSGIMAVEALECGAHHTLCLTRSPGHERLVLWAWGSNAFGQCGRAFGTSVHSTERNFPTPLADFLPPSRHWPLAVAAGRTHSAVLATSSTATSATTHMAGAEDVNFKQAAWSPLRVSAEGPEFAKPNRSLGRRLGRFQAKDLHRFGAATRNREEDDAGPGGLSGLSEARQGEVIEDFCAKLMPNATPSIPRSMSVPSRAPSLNGSLGGLVALGEEELRGALRRPSAKTQPGAPSRRLGFQGRPDVRHAAAPVRRCASEARLTSLPRQRQAPPRSAATLWAPGFHDSSEDDSPVPVRWNTRVNPVSQSETATHSTFLRSPPPSEMSPPAPATHAPHVPPVMSLSEQRWSGVRSLLQDLEDAVACVIKRRSAHGTAGGLMDIPSTPAPRLGRTGPTGPSCQRGQVHQDPVACRGAATPTGGGREGGAGAAAHRVSLFRRQSSSHAVTDAWTQVDFCGHGLAGHGASGTAPSGAELPRDGDGENVEAAPFQLGEASPKASVTAETTMATTALETTAAVSDVAAEVKKMEEQSAAQLLRPVLLEWRKHVASRQKAPQELRSIMDSLESGTESLVSVEEDTGDDGIKDLRATPHGRPKSEGAPFSDGIAGPEGQTAGRSAAEKDVAVDVAKSATAATFRASDTRGGAMSGSSSSLASGQVECLEDLDSAGSDSS